MNIIDTHTHLHFTTFQNDLATVLDRCRAAGVEKQILIGCDEISTLSALDMAHEHDDLVATVGLHPCDAMMAPDKRFFPKKYQHYQRQAQTIPELVELFDQLIADHRDVVVGIGETGFDRYHDGSEELYQRQLTSLNLHIDLAQKWQLPVIFHLRNANDEFDAWLEGVKPGDFTGIVHCYGDGPERAKRYVEHFGFMLGIGGIITYPGSKALRAAVAEIPLEFLLTETDAPFLTPHEAKKKTKRNDASFLPEVIATIAQVKNIPVDECAAVLADNARSVFKLT